MPSRTRDYYFWCFAAAAAAGAFAFGHDRGISPNPLPYINCIRIRVQLSAGVPSCVRIIVQSEKRNCKRSSAYGVIIVFFTPAMVHADGLIFI